MAARPVSEAFEPTALLFDGVAGGELVVCAPLPVCAAEPEEPEPEELEPGAPLVDDAPPVPPTTAVGVADASGYAAPTGLISNGADCAQTCVCVSVRCQCREN